MKENMKTNGRKYEDKWNNEDKNEDPRKQCDNHLRNNLMKFRNRVKIKRDLENRVKIRRDLENWVKIKREKLGQNKDSTESDVWSPLSSA